MNTFEITIQHKSDESWPVTVNYIETGELPVRHEDTLCFQDDWEQHLLRFALEAKAYGTVLGEALFSGKIEKAFTAARAGSPDGLQVLLSVEAPDLKHLHWERLCGPIRSGDRWDFLALDQRFPFSLYLPSPTDRRFPAIGRRDLKALVLVANPPVENQYQFDHFDARATVAGIRTALGDIHHDILANVPDASGPPTLNALLTQLTAQHYILLHIVAHGWYRDEDQETILYLLDEKEDIQPVIATDFLDRLDQIQGPRGLPHFVFLGTCESARPEAEYAGALGGLAQRLVRELGMPAVVAMTEKVSIATAEALASSFYVRLREHGRPDLALTEASVGLAERGDVIVPALYSRLGGRALFSDSEDRELTTTEIEDGLSRLEGLLKERAPVLQESFRKWTKTLRGMFGTQRNDLSPQARNEWDESLREVNSICEEVLDLNFRALALGQEPPAYDERCPFQGLYPFHEDDREFFFGREALVQTLQQKLRQNRFLAVLGPSGSGKSSVVLAGLIPILQEEQQLTMIYLTPGSDPVGQLEASMTTVDEKPAVVVVDQFEELFTLCPNEVKRQEFLNNLLTLPEHLPLVITMRADFWGECAPYRELKERMQQNQELIAPMGIIELRRAMEQQAQTVGLRFEADLSHTILKDVQGEPGAMPLLQHALQELWKRRHGRWLRAEEYRALGGVQKAIAETAEAVYRKLTNEEWDRVRDIFVRLTRLDEEVVQGEERRDTRRRVELEGLVPAGEDLKEGTRNLVNCLADAKLVVTSVNEATGRQEVEVAHEALIHHWPRLQRWLNEDRDILRLRQRISQEAKAWEESRQEVEKREESLLLLRGSRLEEAETLVNNPRVTLNAWERTYVDACVRSREKEKARQRNIARFRLGAIGVIGLLIIGALIIGLWSFKRDAERLATIAQQQIEFANEQKLLRAEAETRRIEAEKAKEEAERQTRLAISRQLTVQAQAALETHPQQSLLLAVEALNITLREGEPRVPVAENILRVALANSGGRGLDGHESTVTAVAFSPDNHWLITASRDATVRLWNVTTQDLAITPIVLRDHESAITAAVVSPDNHWLITGSEDATARLWDLTAVQDPAYKPVILRHDEAITTAIISRDSRWLATGSLEGTTYLWDLAAIQDSESTPLIFRGHESDELNWITALAMSSDNRWLVAGSVDGTARLWDLTAQNPSDKPFILQGTDFEAIASIAISSDAHWLVIGREDGTAHLWDLTAQDPSTKSIMLQAHEFAITAVAISADNHWLVTASWDATARLWDLTAQDPTAESIVLNGHESGIAAVAMSPDSHWLVTGGEDQTIRLWDLTAQVPSKDPVILRGHEAPIAAIAISADNHWLVTGSKDATARLWDLTHPMPTAEAFTFHDYRGPVYSVAISPDNHWLVSKNYDDHIVRLRDLSNLDPLAEPMTLRHEGSVTAIAVSPDSNWLVTGSRDHSVRLWNLNAEKITDKPIILHGHKDTITSIAMSHDSRWLVTGSRDRTARLWDLTTQEFPANPIILNGHEKAITAAAMSSNNHWLVTGSMDRTARLWDLTAQNPAATNPMILSGHERGVTAATFSPDNHWLVTGSMDQTIRLWDLSAQDPAANPIILPGHWDWVTTTIAISPDNHWLVTCSRNGDHTAGLWDLTAQDPAAAIILHGHEEKITTVTFSPDNQWLITGSKDHTARLWDLTTQNPAAASIVLRGHTGSILSAAISSDSHRLITGGFDGTIRLWTLQLDELIETACWTAGRNFTQKEWEQYMEDRPYRATCPNLPTGQGVPAGTTDI